MHDLMAGVAEMLRKAGYAIVPVEPTITMLAAQQEKCGEPFEWDNSIPPRLIPRGLGSPHIAERYKAMIEAAPDLAAIRYAVLKEKENG